LEQGKSQKKNEQQYVSPYLHPMKRKSSKQVHWRSAIDDRDIKDVFEAASLGALFAVDLISCIPVVVSNPDFMI
jgi:hypothetical protein